MKRILYITLILLTNCSITYSQYFQIGYRTELFNIREGADKKLSSFNAVEGGVGVSLADKYHLTLYSAYGFTKSKKDYRRDEKVYRNFDCDGNLKENGVLELSQTNIKIGLGHEFRLFKSKVLTFGISSELIIISKHTSTYNIDRQYSYSMNGNEITMTSPIRYDFTRVTSLDRNEKFFHPFIFNLSVRALDKKLIISAFYHSDISTDYYEPKNSATYGLKLLYRFKLERKS